MFAPRTIARAIAGLLLSAALAPAARAVPPITVDELRAHVYRLADPEMEGRGLGTAGIDTAAAYIAREFSRVGLEPGGPYGSYFQSFGARVGADLYTAKNVIGVLAGRDSLPRPYIVLGAHYDHLGYGGKESREPGVRALHPGADDNASGVAALIEVAERFAAAGRPNRTLVFVAFSGEEKGLLGSAYFVDHPPYPLESTLAMINFDAVGRPDRGEVTVFGTRSAAELDRFLDRANADGLIIQREADGLGPSDQTSFLVKNIPAVHLFGAAHLDYHRPTDTAEKLDYDGLRAIARLAARLVEALDSTPSPLEFRQPESGPRAHVSGRGAYLGIVPDFGSSGEGLALRAVRAGSPAEGGDLRAGDVIVAFGGREVKDIQGLFDALHVHGPGDTVAVDLLRDGGRLTRSVVLGRRNSGEED